MIEIEEESASSAQTSKHVLQEDGAPLLDPASRSGTIALGTS